MEIRKPYRVTRTYTQRLFAEPARVFPLLCPVREADWADGWDPLWVASETGVAEDGCVFVTPDTPHDAVWMVTRYDPGTGFVEMVMVVPEVTASRLSISLAPSPAGTDARVTYTHTSLGPEGDAFVAAFTQEYYEAFMREWEAQLNHYLTTGEMLRASDG